MLNETSNESMIASEMHEINPDYVQELYNP